MNNDTGEHDGDVTAQVEAALALGLAVLGSAAKLQAFYWVRPGRLAVLY